MPVGGRVVIITGWVCWALLNGGFGNPLSYQHFIAEQALITIDWADIEIPCCDAVYINHKLDIKTTFRLKFEPGLNTEIGTAC